MRICTFTYKSIGASDDFEPLGPIFSVTAQGGVRLLIAN